ncbi:enoyl-CoA hydratase/isomerase family protein [Arenibaculum pallidiluteum]|uniref:enoyl-CoA hydratase/isomerase family protein n=1 Tax=Arenibaculum pallidiluteum TaxID=2812559 RepID=UPI001F252129|nr:enoyl-CoA hydratase-related protein [Arenibaculum pallidiluteum]
MTDLNNRVRLEVSEAVATVTLDRPEALNALDPAMAEGLHAALARCEADEAVRAVVIRGAGGAFMAGGDVKMFAGLLAEPGGSPRAFFEKLISTVHQSVILLRRMPKPVIAAVEGPCAGFGFSLMLACDLAVAAEDAVLTLAYCHIGASPDGGATFHLPRVVGARRAAEIALLGDRFGAAEAERLGLVNRVVPAASLEAETLSLAHRLAAGPTAAYARTKALLNASLDRPLESQLQAEAESFAAGAATRDFAEGVAAFVAKRKPVFQGR